MYICVVYMCSITASVISFRAICIFNNYCNFKLYYYSY